MIALGKGTTKEKREKRKKVKALHEPE